MSEDAYHRLMSTHYTEYAHVAVGYDEDPWPDYPTDIVLPVGEGGVRNVGYGFAWSAPASVSPERGRKWLGSISTRHHSKI